MTTIYTPTTMPRIFHPSKMLQEIELPAMLISCKKLYMKLWTEAMNSEILEETKIELNYVVLVDQRSLD